MSALTARMDALICPRGITPREHGERKLGQLALVEAVLVWHWRAVEYGTPRHWRTDRADDDAHFERRFWQGYLYRDGGS